jgi:type IV pilus assembly protein PilE
MHSPENKSLGFAMIEVMIAAAIAIILAVLAFPSYRESVRKAKRAEAQALLVQLMQQQERYFSQNNSYIAFSSSSQDADARLFKWFSGNNPTSSAYEIDGQACPNDLIANCILLTATPGTSRVDSGFTDPHCGPLLMRSTGEKSAGSGATDCWY